jgi:hypothetical protein
MTKSIRIRCKKSLHTFCRNVCKISPFYIIVDINPLAVNSLRRKLNICVQIFTSIAGFFTLSVLLFVLNVYKICSTDVGVARGIPARRQQRYYFRPADLFEYVTLSQSCNTFFQFKTFSGK